MDNLEHKIRERIKPPYSFLQLEMLLMGLIRIDSWNSNCENFYDDFDNLFTKYRGHQFSDKSFKSLAHLWYNFVVRLHDCVVADLMSALAEGYRIKFDNKQARQIKDEAKQIWLEFKTKLLILDPETEFIDRNSNEEEDDENDELRDDYFDIIIGKEEK